jgi:hypothetical protein
MNPARWWRPGDDTGSMAMAMLLTLVGMTLTAMLLPVVVRQIAATQSTVERSRALHAAQAGLDVALAQIRAANDGNGAGRLSELPCGEITGSVGTGSTARYQVTVRYYREDPHGKSEEWLRDNAISCVVGGGTYVTPAFALLTAAGTDQASGAFAEVSTRDLRGTYTFQTTNQNIAGGLVHVYKTATSRDLCLDAGSGSPAAGANVTMQVCAAGSAQQKFAYNNDLTLSLVSSLTGANPKGMCLTVAAQALGRVVHFQPCQTPAPPGQRWSFNDNANFQGTTDSLGLSDFCFNVQNRDTPGSLVVLGSISSGTCRRSAYDNLQTFSPDAAVGAGAAGPTNSQLVNFKQFGRCLDVTNTDVRSTFLIAWPCKQAPNPVDVTWNQKWALPTIGAGGTGSGRITTTRSGVVYCLQSPRDPAYQKYVVVVACPLVGLLPDELTWTVARATGSYATSYRIMDKAGYCLEPREEPTDPPDYFASGQKISKIYVAPCTSSTLQKWNAPPNIESATPIKDIAEK